MDVRLATELLQELGSTPDVRRVASRVEQGVFPLTFDADAHLRRPFSELVSIHHPFVLLACTFLERDTERLHRTFHLRIPTDSYTKAGDYLLSVLEFTISGNRARTEIVPVAWDLQADRPIEADASRHLFIRLLEMAESVEGIPAVSNELIKQGTTNLKNHLGHVRTDIRSREVKLQAARAARRRATQQVTLDAKVRAARLRLGRLKGRRAEEFAVRMANARLRKEQSRLDAFLRESSDEATVSIEERLVALALVSTTGRGAVVGAAR